MHVFFALVHRWDHGVHNQSIHKGWIQTNKQNWCHWCHWISKKSYNKPWKQPCWLVVGPPLCKIWVRQLGWLETQYEWENAKFMATSYHQPGFGEQIICEKMPQMSMSEINSRPTSASQEMPCIATWSYGAVLRLWKICENMGWNSKDMGKNLKIQDPGRAAVRNYHILGHRNWGSSEISPSKIGRTDMVPPNLGPGTYQRPWILAADLR